jgi:GNAT superfamily N-acetyltransferase
MDFTIDAVAEPDDAMRDAILKPLVAFNASRAGEADFTELALLVRDAGGAIAGGLFAKSIYDWMFIELMVVPEALRGRGVGSDLMDRAEAAARAKGCVGVWLDTFSFQARPFYEKRGYAVFGTLDDHPRGQCRYFLRKVFGG